MTVSDNSAINAEIAQEIYTLGMTLLRLDKPREAAFQFRKALLMAPDYSDAALALGHCLHLQMNFREALIVYDRLLAVSPSHAAAWNNRGNALLEMGCSEEAATSYLLALEHAPGLHDAKVALASCYQSMGMLGDARKACESVLADHPEHAEAHWNRSLLLLLNGEMREGWREYEWRWRKRAFTSPQRNFPQPRWQGEPADGTTILIHAEQGFGDTIQFCRYIALLAERGMRVIFECQPPLVTLMKGLQGAEEVVPMGCPLPHFDRHLPLLSLPLIFETTVETIPSAAPYLVPPEDRLEKWHSLIAARNHCRIGLCWAGKSYPDPRRSCPAHLLTPLSDVSGVSWYSLQLDRQEDLPMAMIDLTGHIRDFADTAALIAQLDLVVTIDTAVAHLAGALGVPVWLLLPNAPDWRWLLDREDSPWYPSMRLFRQKKTDAWSEPVQKILHILQTGGSIIAAGGREEMSLLSEKH